jgi:Ricin-type beta-trefoil lectin domain/Gametolysin peptidase M11
MIHSRPMGCGRGTMPNLVLHVRARVAAALMLATLACLGFSQALAQQSAKPETHRVLVIPVNLRGHAAVEVDRKQITQALYGAEDSVASRYGAISYGKLIFAGSESDITDPVTLAEPADFCDTGLKRLADAAANEVRGRAVPLWNYQHFVFVIPKDASCPWTGVGDIGGNRVWVKATTAKALQHELGHNLGMNHAVQWRSPDAEASDFMGSGGASLNAPHVIQMGWLQDFAGKVIDVTGAGDVTLEALEADPRQTAVPKVAIVRPAPGANTYFLSYRASNATNSLPDDFTRGLNIHVFNETRQIGGLTFLVTSLSDGATYSDGPMIVRQISHTENGHVTFHISFTGTGQAIPAGPPPAPPGTVQSLASGKCLDLPGGQTGDGTLPIQYDCRGSPNQQWDMVAAGGSGYRIVSRLSGKCIGTDPAHAAAGGDIVQTACVNSPAQLWTLEGGANAYVVRNVATRLCLDVPGASATNGTKPITWTCNGGANQTWRYIAPTAP